MKAEIDAILELRDTALIDAVEEKEMDFLDNYNRHMTHIYMQMQRFKRLSNNNTFLIRKNQKVMKLTQDRDSFEASAMVLAKDCDKFRISNERLTSNNKELMSEKIYLMSAARRLKHVNKQLE